MSDALPALPALAIKGVLLGWSVAWIPGPINTEILRRGLRDGPRAGFMVGVGATSADFLWALAVCAGVSAAAATPGVARVLAAASAALLLLLGARFAGSALRAARRSADADPDPAPGTAAGPPARAAGGRGALVGFAMAALSPFNVAFWLGVMGQDAARGVSGPGMLVLAVGVVMGALAWCTVLCAALRLGARTRSARWEALTEALAAALMLGFGARMALAPALWGS